MKTQIVEKIRKSYSLLKKKSSIINGVSYYPECEHKSKTEILKDQLFFIWKYGNYEPFYLLMGSTGLK